MRVRTPFGAEFTESLPGGRADATRDRQYLPR
jgi:hypothetical protein